MRNGSKRKKEMLEMELPENAPDARELNDLLQEVRDVTNREGGYANDRKLGSTPNLPTQFHI